MTARARESAAREDLQRPPVPGPKDAKIALFDPLAGEEGHLVRDDLLLARALRRVASEVTVVSSRASVAGVREAGEPGIEGTGYAAVPDVLARRLGSRWTWTLRGALTRGVRGFDAVVVPATHELTVLAFRLLHPRVPLFVCVTNSFGGNLERPAKRLLLGLALRWADGVGVYSEHDVRQVERWFPSVSGRVHRLPYAPLGAVRDVVPFEGRERLIAFVGHQKAEKGLERMDVLVRADRAGDFAFGFYGRGVPELDGRFALPGERLEVARRYLDDEEYWSVLGRAMYVALPYHRSYEGRLSGIFVDAVVSGTPVLAPRMEPYMTYFEEFGPLGLLVDFDDPDGAPDLAGLLDGERYRAMQRNMKAVVAAHDRTSVEERIAAAVGSVLE